MDRTPDIDRLPFAFVPEHPSDRLRIAFSSRLLAGDALKAGSAVAGFVPGGAGHVLGRAWARSVVRALDLTITMSGLENAEPGRTFLVAPLHESFVDIPVLLHLPLDLRFTVREELVEHDVIGAVLRRTGQIVVPEHPSISTLRGLMDEVTVATRAGESVVVFPQGSVLGVEASFSSGLIAMSRALRLPVLPVVLTGTHRVWGHPFDNMVRLHQAVAMRVLEPISAGDLDPDGFRDLERTMKNFALASSVTPVRRFEPERDGWWDDYAYTIDDGFPELAAAVAKHRATVVDASRQPPPI